MIEKCCIELLNEVLQVWLSFFLQGVPDKKVRNHHGKTALQLAEIQGHQEVEVLLRSS